MSAIGLRRLGSIVAAFVLQTALLRAALPGPDEATHNPISMARMDRLFGVTMAKRGVSQIVSVELAEAERFAEAGDRLACPASESPA